MDSKILVCICDKITEKDGSTSLIPIIPFDQFPPGDRFAEPDESGRLAWYVIVRDLPVKKN